jgi:hypothetical protein
VTEQVDSLVATGDGGAVVTITEHWRSTRISLRAHRLGPAGNRAWRARGVALSDPLATALDFGSYGFVEDALLHVGWVHQRAPRSESFDVYAVRYTLGGRRLGPPAGVPVITDPPAHFLRGLLPDRRQPVRFALFNDAYYEGGVIVDDGVSAALFQLADQ